MGGAKGIYATVRMYTPLYGGAHVHPDMTANTLAQVACLGQKGLRVSLHAVCEAAGSNTQDSHLII